MGRGRLEMRGEAGGVKGGAGASLSGSTSGAAPCSGDLPFSGDVSPHQAVSY